MLEAQRAAFYAGLPVSPASRRDRLQRAMQMIGQNAEALCRALVADGTAPDAESARAAEVEPALAALQAALDGVERWMQPEKARGLLARARGDHVEYQPIGVIGVALPASLPLFRIAGLLAGIFAAGNRVMLQFDAASPRLAELVGELAPHFFDPLELAVVTDGGFAELAFDLLLTHEPQEDHAAMAARSGKSPVIVGRSADFAKIAGTIVAHKRANGGRAPLAPDFLLAPDDQEEAIADWLWRAAVRAGGDRALLSGTEQRRLTRLLDDARARGGEVRTAEPRRGGMPFHIVRHASDDMLLMQEDIRGPILPIRNYARIEDAIAAIRRRPPPLSIYYFGRDAAERRHVLEQSLSSAIAIDGAVPSLAKAGLDAGRDIGRGEADFRRFSRIRRVCRPRLFGFLGRAGRRAGDGVGEAAPALR
ncbi:aldehyde dehydrogenase family protein [Sphingopyxis indica]|uniref:Coniferyl-aldehyde dehydrogenase n=1 Tax=Sphingopyxis indica TaxID=436663 RepID=A0A239D0R6_9SPHN|nr:aldehyde dehydrogenase family protein [Sphingopyxis indica]SNS25940.1 coniferyl-aldehyde dehydrogenase [Sphingopyxis indica]